MSPYECKVYRSQPTSSTIGVHIVLGNTVRQFVRPYDFSKIMGYDYKSLPFSSYPSHLRHGSSLFGTALVRNPNDGKLFLTSWYDRMEIKNSLTFSACRFDNQKIDKISLAELERAPLSNSIDVFSYV